MTFKIIKCKNYINKPEYSYKMYLGDNLLGVLQNIKSMDEEKIMEMIENIVNLAIEVHNGSENESGTTSSQP